MKADYSLVYSHDYEQEKQDVSGLLFHSVTVNSLHLKIQRNKENLNFKIKQKNKKKKDNRCNCIWHSDVFKVCNYL